MFQANFSKGEPNLFGGGGGGGGGGTQFGAGGGFVPSPAAEPSQGLKPNFHQQTLRAVTIKQIKAAISSSADESLVVDGEDLNNITLVAKIVSLSENATNYDMQVDDGTGRLEVKLYVDSDDESAPMRRRECEPGHYVRIHGHLRPIDNKYPLVAFNIRQISDFNEVSFHFLSCIYQHAHFTKGAGKPANAQAPASASKPAAGFQGAGGNEGNVYQAVRQAFQSAPETALSVNQVVDSLNGRFSYQQVLETAQALTDEGMVYSVRDDVFQSCS